MLKIAKRNLENPFKGFVYQTSIYSESLQIE